MEPIFIKDFLPQQVFNLVNNYCIFKFGNQKEFLVDTQSNSCCGETGDYLMESLLDMSTPVIENNLNKKLYPTYSYIRIYDKESDLPVHMDRPSCEYTVALCLGADPQDKPYEIFIGEKNEESKYSYFDSKKNYIPLEILNSFPMLPNDALIFKGAEKYHWREFCKHDHFITVFLHFVEQEGLYKEFKYDQRNSIGDKKKEWDYSYK